VRIQKIILVPFKYVNIFLADDITPSLFYNTFYPQMVIDGTDNSYASFIIFFRVAMTKTAVAPALSSIECPLAVAPPHNVVLLHLRNSLIGDHHSPALNQNFAQLQQNAITTQIANFSQQTQLN